MVTYEEVAGVTTWFELTVQKGPMSKKYVLLYNKKFTKLAGLTKHTVLFCSNKNLRQNTYMYLYFKNKGKEGGGGIGGSKRRKLTTMLTGQEWLVK